MCVSHGSWETVRLDYGSNKGLKYPQQEKNSFQGQDVQVVGEEQVRCGEWTTVI